MADQPISIYTPGEYGEEPTPTPTGDGGTSTIANQDECKIIEGVAASFPVRAHT